MVQSPVVPQLDNPLDIDKLTSAICSVQDQKPTGRDGIASEVWKHDGLKMTNCLYKLTNKVWATQNIPQDWKNVSIVPLYKKR